MRRILKIAFFRNLVGILLVSLLGSGCINTKSLPTYARAGEIINIGIAGIKLNTDGMVTLRSGDIAATISDANSAIHNVKVLKTYRAFPDNTSYYIVGAMDRSTNNVFYGAMEPFDGQWWVALHLVDPVTDAPLPLAVGNATLQLSVAAITDTWGSDGSLDALDIEIISGVENKSPTNSDFYLYAGFDQRQTLTIQPDTLTGIAKISGLQLKLDYDPAALTVGTTLTPHLVPISHDPHINIIQHNIDNGDGTHALIVMITNPLGFVPAAAYSSGWVIGASTFKDLNFAVLTDDDNLMNYATNYSIDSMNSFYVDENGDKLITVNPVLGLNY